MTDRDPEPLHISVIADLGDAGSVIPFASQLPRGAAVTISIYVDAARPDSRQDVSTDSSLPPGPEELEEAVERAIGGRLSASALLEDPDSAAVYLVDSRVQSYSGPGEYLQHLLRCEPAFRVVVLLSPDRHGDLAELSLVRSNSVRVVAISENGLAPGGNIDAVAAGGTIVSEALTSASKVIAPASTASPEPSPNPDPASSETREPVGDRSYEEILNLLSYAYGLRLEFYKRPMLIRRIKSAMSETGISSADGYLKILRAEFEERERLRKHLDIHVTSFNRDPEVFEWLGRNTIARISESSEEELKVWVPACASGEEAYTIAMLFAEASAGAEDLRRIRIFATDVSEELITRARTGSYSEKEISGLRSAHREKYLLREDDRYRVRAEIRSLVTFSVHDVLLDPPLSGMHLVSCRNLMIYLSPDGQRQLVPTLHFALRPGGMLLLGTSEGGEGMSRYFEEVHARFRIYRALPQPSALETFRNYPGSVSEARQRESVGNRTEQRRYADFVTRVRALLLRQTASPSILCGEDGEIVYVNGEVNRYLDLGQGLPSANLIELAVSGLRGEIIAAIDQALSSSVAITRRRVNVGFFSDPRRVDFTVVPVTRILPSRRCVLVIFHEDRHDLNEAQERPESDPDSRRADAAGFDPEQELSVLSEHYRSAMHELQRANEELRERAEELHAKNEELQSGNEEIESAREEMRILNDDLRSANQRLSRRPVNRIVQAILFHDGRVRAISGIAPDDFESGLPADAAGLLDRFALGEYVPEVMGAFEENGTLRKQCFSASGGEIGLFLEKTIGIDELHGSGRSVSYSLTLLL